MNRERLQHLITVLRQVEEQEKQRSSEQSQLIMSSWYRPKDVAYEDFLTVAQLNQEQASSPTCGFAACALGWAALDKTFQEQGLKPAFAPLGYYIPTYGDFYGYRAAQAFFVLSERWADFLFDPSTYVRSEQYSDLADEYSAILDEYYAVPDALFLPDEDNIPISCVIDRISYVLQREDL